MGNGIPLPDTFVASTTAYMATLLGNFAPYIYLTLGIVGVAFLISVFIGSFK